MNEVMLHQYNLLSKELQQEVQHYIEYLFLKIKSWVKKADEENTKETQADKLSDTSLFGTKAEIVSDKKLFEVSNNLIHKNLDAYKELAQWFSLHNNRLKKCTVALSVQPAERYTQNELADLGLGIASGNITREEIKKWISLHTEFDQVIWVSSFYPINIEPNIRLVP